MGEGEVLTRAAHKVGRQDGSDWLDVAARVGLTAYGVVHLVIAWLALQLAFGDRQGSPSSSGAISELAQQPFGKVLVWAVAIGMFLLVVWQGIEAVAGHRDEDGGKRTGKRLLSAGKCAVYAAIGISAVKVAVGSGSSGKSSEKQTDSMTATIMDLPAGQLLVGAVGLGIVGVGVAFAVRAWTEKFAKHLDAEGKSGSTGRAYLWFGKVGYAAKGVALGVVGSLFCYAALTHDAEESGGLDQALHEVLDKPFGPVLLGVIAVGIGCYGLFCLARARHLSR
ncbi:DUF1206 domain-containing protein [Nocardioides sp.]|uniref:DUF1206 domain-containing protein n=1 Tax=Nocardioides sp. TaxID=35761 RepID=UPI001A2ADAAF|nr:DUF1206 domain-containing protein [Nocardioides sp.]MBJ7358251.1 DUF1206 domain-containing protein [Nocardioides sp.]